MKNLSVVFPVFKSDEKTYVLLGKQAPGKKMPGIRNGFGGKCNYLEDEQREETTVECAIRELSEESGISVNQHDLIKIGNIINGDKSVDFYALHMKEMIKIDDNNEMVEIAWFDLNNLDTFVGEMLSGDRAVIEELSKYCSAPNTYTEFYIDKTGDKVLDQQTKDIYKRL